jgi:threonine synthase
VKAGPGLICYFCRKRYAYDPHLVLCPDCREPLGLSYPPAKRTIRRDRELPLERYLEFLPLVEVDPGLSLGEGRTPMIPLRSMCREAGGASVLAKNEAANPTGSFKDRGTAVVVQKARALGLARVGTVSTGNMAASTAAYCARAGLEATLLVKGDTSPEKIKAAAVYSPRLIRVEGDYGAVFDKSLALGRSRGIYFANSVDPVRVEGYKLTVFEIYEQLGRRMPRCLVVPVSSGGHFLGLARACLDLRDAGLIPHLPVLAGVQAAGCAPLALAVREGRARYDRFPEPRTLAHAISNPTPPGGNVVLKLVRENGGLVLDVTDAEMLEARRRLASDEGLFVLPDSAAVVAALRELPGPLGLTAADTVVLIITGTGLKNLEDLNLPPGRTVSLPLSALEGGLPRPGG